MEVSLVKISIFFTQSNKTKGYSIVCKIVFLQSKSQIGMDIFLSIVDDKADINSNFYSQNNIDQIPH